jgi:two-component system, chemotaxis family, protein-glutamate methylesterase/glutaminase
MLCVKAMKKIRVLITDDSTVIRKLVSDALSGDPALEIVGLASNGKIALAKIPQVNPDVITLDIEMPEMDGLTTLKEIRKTYPKLPVIMFSTLTEKGAVATINALSLGATDYVTKPANVGSVTAAIQTVRDSLIPKIKTFCRWEEPAAPPLVRRPAGLARPTLSSQPKLASRVDIIAIGVSTGGPNALTEVFKALPADLPVPIVIVQHMPPVFTKYLAERLNTVSPLEVREATAGEVLRPGCAWLAPGDHHLTVVRSGTDVITRLHQGPPENSCRPAVDVLFRSVAALYGPTALGVVLTGMGYDGLRGCEAIRGAGGHVVVQDEATSVVWGMPGAVADAGLADEILPLSKVAQHLSNLTAFRPKIRPLTLATK